MMSTKRRMTRWMVPAGVMLTLGLFAVADTASAQPPGPGAGRMGRRQGPPPGGSLMHLGRLDLSDGQREQIRSIREQNREAAQAAEERVRVARQALQAAVTAEAVNEGAIRAVATELGSAEGDAAVQRAYLHAQVWQVLTADQQAAAREAEAQMKDGMARRQQRMGERRGRRQQRRQQG